MTGCGTYLFVAFGGSWHCGTDGLCPSCAAKLQARLEELEQDCLYQQSRKWDAEQRAEQAEEWVEELRARWDSDPVKKAYQTRDEAIEAGRKAEAERDRLREAIQRAIADSESGDGWGPDVTVVGYLRDALEERE